MKNKELEPYHRAACRNVQAALQRELRNHSSTNALAALLKLSPPSLAAYLAGETVPSPAQCLRISTILNVTIQDLLDPQ